MSGVILPCIVNWIYIMLLMGRKHYKKKDFIVKITSSHKFMEICVQNFVNWWVSLGLHFSQKKKKKRKRFGPFFFFFFLLEIWVGGWICDLGRFPDLLGWVYADLCCGYGPFWVAVGFVLVSGVKLLGSISIQWVCTWAEVFASFVLGLLGLMSSF